MTDCKISVAHNQEGGGVSWTFEFQIRNRNIYQTKGLVIYILGKQPSKELGKLPTKVDWSSSTTSQKNLTWKPLHNKISKIYMSITVKLAAVL